MELFFQEITFVFVQCKAKLAQSSYRKKFKNMLAFFLTLYNKESVGGHENLKLRS